MKPAAPVTRTGRFSSLRCVMPAVLALPLDGWVDHKAWSGRIRPHEPTKRPSRVRRRPSGDGDLQRPLVRPSVCRRILPAGRVPRLARERLVAGASSARPGLPEPCPHPSRAARLAQLAVDKARLAARRHRRPDRHGPRLLCGLHTDGAHRPSPRQGPPAPAPRPRSVHLLAAAPGPPVHPRTPSRPVLTVAATLSAARATHGLVTPT